MTANFVKAVILSITILTALMFGVLSAHSVPMHHAATALLTHPLCGYDGPDCFHIFRGISR